MEYADYLLLHYHQFTISFGLDNKSNRGILCNVTGTCGDDFPIRTVKKQQVPLGYWILLIFFGGIIQNRGLPIRHIITKVNHVGCLLISSWKVHIGRVDLCPALIVFGGVCLP